MSNQISLLDFLGPSSVLLSLMYLWVVFLGCALRRSRVYDVAVVILLGFLAWANTDAADLTGVYMPQYADPMYFLQLGDGDNGWLVLCMAGNLLHLSYNGFACVVTAGATALIAYTARRLTPNESFFLALFLLYPGLLSLVQLRQYVASAVAMAAVLVLVGKEGRWRLLLFVGLLFVAYTIHRSAAFMFLVLLVPLWHAVPRPWRVLVAIVLGVVLVVGLANWDDLAAFFFGEQKTGYYMRAAYGDTSQSSGGNASSFRGGALNALLIVFMAVLVPRCSHLLSDEGVEDPALTAVCSFVNLSCLALVPFVFVTADFMRFERYGYMLALYVLAGMPSLAHKGSVRMLISNKFVIVAICLVYGYFLSMRGSMRTEVWYALLTFEYLPAFFV